MAMSVPAKPTLALVYFDEVYIQRNRIRQKLADRGFVIKKEYASTSKRFDFSTVDVVVAIADGLAPGVVARLENAAADAGVDLLVLPHQTTKGGWERLDTYGSPPATPTHALLAAPAPVEADKETAELFAIVEAERDEARAHAQKLAGDLGNVRADRERLTKTEADLRGKVAKLEAELEQAKLGTGEVQEQREAWANRLGALEMQVTSLEADIAAAREQNRRLVGERDAARERAERQETSSRELQRLRDDVERLTKERKHYADAYKMAAAREAQARERAADLAMQLDTEKRGVPARIKTLTEELSKTSKRLVEAQSEVVSLKRELASRPQASSGRDLGQVANALAALVSAGLMTEGEAFEKLVEAARKS